MSSVEYFIYAFLGGFVGAAIVMAPTVWKVVVEVKRHGLHNDRRCRVVGCCS